MTPEEFNVLCYSLGLGLNVKRQREPIRYLIENPDTEIEDLMYLKGKKKEFFENFRYAAERIYQHIPESVISENSLLTPEERSRINRNRAISVNARRYSFDSRGLSEKEELAVYIKIIRAGLEYVGYPHKEHRKKDSNIETESDQFTERLISTYINAKGSSSRTHDIHLDLSSESRQQYAKHIVDRTIELMMTLPNGQTDVALPHDAELEKSHQQFDSFLQGQGADILENPQSPEQADNLFLRMLRHSLPNSNE